MSFKENIGDGTGAHKKREAAKNRQDIMNYFIENRGRTRSDCARALGLTIQTVCTHIKALISEEGE